MPNSSPQPIRPRPVEPVVPAPIVNQYGQTTAPYPQTQHVWPYYPTSVSGGGGVCMPAVRPVILASPHMQHMQQLQLASYQMPHHQFPLAQLANRPAGAIAFRPTSPMIRPGQHQLQQTMTHNQEEDPDLSNVVDYILRSPPPPPPPPIGEANVLSSNCHAQSSAPTVVNTNSSLDLKPNTSVTLLPFPILQFEFTRLIEGDWTKNLLPNERHSLDTIIQVGSNVIGHIRAEHRRYDAAVRIGNNAEASKIVLDPQLKRTIKILLDAEVGTKALRDKVEKRLSRQEPVRKKAKTMKKNKKNKESGPGTKNNQNNPQPISESINQQTSNSGAKIISSIRLCDQPDIKPSKELLDKLVENAPAVENHTNDDETRESEDEDEREAGPSETSVNPFDVVGALTQMQQIQKQNNVPARAPNIMSFVEDNLNILNAATNVAFNNKTVKNSDPIETKAAIVANLPDPIQVQAQTDLDYRLADKDKDRVDIIEVSDLDEEHVPKQVQDPYMNGIEPQNRWIMEEMRPLAEKYNCRDRLVSALEMVRRRVYLINGLNWMEFQLQRAC